MARDIKQLHPDVQKLANKLVEECKKKGLKIKITECLRTKAEQDALYAQGRTTKGNIVTKVKYPYSFHCWGLAFDICRNDGKGAYNTSDNFFQKVSKIGVSLGLDSGATWKTFVDLPHYQLNTYGKTCAELVKKYGTPEKFIATWSKTTTKSVDNTTTKTDTTKLKELTDLQSAMKKYKDLPLISKNANNKHSLVKPLQKYLKKLGYYTSAIDGIAGNNFDKAVKELQKKAKLSSDGNIGDGTWNWISKQ